MCACPCLGEGGSNQIFPHDKGSINFKKCHTNAFLPFPLVLPPSLPPFVPPDHRRLVSSAVTSFTITAEINAHSLANFIVNMRTDT